MKRDPETWRVVPLGEICELVNGRGFKPHEWKKSGLPIIRIQNLNGSTEFNYFDGDFDPKIHVVPGQILFAWSGSRGVSFGAHVWKGPEAVLNYHTWKILPAPGVHPPFLLQLLKWLTAEIEHNSHGAAGLVHTQKNIVERWPVHVPPHAEQVRLGNILEARDQAIDAANRLIDAKLRRLSALRASLMIGFDPSRRSYRWPRKEFGQITSELGVRNSDGRLGREAVMGVTKANGLVPMRERTIGADLARYQILPPRAFAYNPMRINVGSITMSRLNANVLVSPDYVLFECLEEHLEPDYLDHLRQTQFWSHYINAAGAGSVRVRIYYDALAEIVAPIPPIKEQRRIVEVLDAAAHDLALNEAYRDALQRQKRGLMQKLLTGKWRVGQARGAA